MFATVHVAAAVHIACRLVPECVCAVFLTDVRILSPFLQPGLLDAPELLHIRLHVVDGLFYTGRHYERLECHYIDRLRPMVDYDDRFGFDFFDRLNITTSACTHRIVCVFA